MRDTVMVIPFTLSPREDDDDPYCLDDIEPYILKLEQTLEACGIHVVPWSKNGVKEDSYFLTYEEFRLDY